MMADAGVTYNVTTVAADIQFTDQGNAIPGRKVSYKTSTGYEGTVFIPNTMFGNMDSVRTIIEAEVKAVAAVQGLTGTVPG